MRIRNFYYLLASFCLTSIAGCDQLNVYETMTPLKGHQWYTGKSISGTFQINDTGSKYRNFFVFRHTDAYSYNNIWVELGLQAPGDSMIYRKLDLSLGNDASGWFGSGMDDIWEVRLPLNNFPQKFEKPGVYHYNIRQLMRDDPLKDVMSVGLRVEKAYP